jgi:hypothetical protein
MGRCWRRVLLAALLALALPAAGAQEQAVADTKRLLLVNVDDGGRYWRLDEAQARGAPKYPRELIREGIGGCVSIGFVIEPDGSTSGFRPLVTWTTRQSRQASLAFTRALEDLVRHQRYAPGPENPQRERGFASTWANFGITRDGSRPDMRDAGCRIEDLGAFMRERAGAATGDARETEPR